MSDSAETMRINKFVTANGDGKIWSAGIDIKKDSEWHYNAIECHSSERELAIARRDAVFAALSASGTKSDGSRVRQTDTDRSHGESLQYGPDTTITTGTDASSIAAKVRDDGNVVNQVEASGRAPHVLLGPSDPILSQPDEREAIARIIDPEAFENPDYVDDLYPSERALRRARQPLGQRLAYEAADAILAMQAERRGDAYTRAQLEAHAAEQVRPLVEALEGLIEAVELDADEGLEGIGSYTGARLTDAKNAIRARGQV